MEMSKMLTTSMMSTAMRRRITIKMLIADDKGKHLNDRMRPNFGLMHWSTLVWCHWSTLVWCHWSTLVWCNWSTLVLVDFGLLPMVDLICLSLMSLPLFGRLLVWIHWSTFVCYHWNTSGIALLPKTPFLIVPLIFCKLQTLQSILPIISHYSFIATNVHIMKVVPKYLKQLTYN